MKLLLIVFISQIIFNQTYPQDGRRGDWPRMHRVEQLERVKLIESLNLTEEQTLRFFSRRNEHRKEIESINKKIDEIMEEMYKIINSGEAKESALKKMNEEILSLREKIESKRKQFILSLNDILTTEQISKLLLFERRFHEEIRELIITRRKPPR